jgi:hypothetical protein
MGRTNHIHFKVRVEGMSGQRTYEAGHTAHVGQIFFPEEVTTQLMQQEPYRGHAIHRTTQTEDGIFQSQHGTDCLAHLDRVNPADPKAGYRAQIVASVDPTATPAPVRGGPPGGFGPPGGPGGRPPPQAP